MAKDKIIVPSFSMEFDEDGYLITSFGEQIPTEAVNTALDAVEAMETSLNFMHWMLEDIDEVKKTILVNALRLAAITFKKAAHNRNKCADTPATAN